MNEQDFAELAAGHALDALSPAERTAFDAARAQHPEWEHWVDGDEKVVATFAELGAEVAPPPQLRAALLAQISGPGEPPLSSASADDTIAEPATAGPQSAEQSTEARRRSWPSRMFALAAGVVLVLALGFGAVMVVNYVNRPAAVVALDEITAAPDAQAETVEVTGGETVTAHWSESLGQAVMVSDGMPEISSESSFEMWYVRDGVPVSAGIFAASDDEPVLLEGAVETGDVIAITVEQSGGSPSGAPTTDPIAVLPTV